ncbi:MAG: hypothetical protein ABH845_04505, partial [Candidatus Omnitrophota bacterium]
MYREHIAILYDDSSPDKKALQSLPAQGDTQEEVRVIEEALSQCGFKTRRLTLVYDRIESFIEELLRAREEIIFNLCEDIKGEGSYEPYVASVLELFGISYTGSD